MNTLFEQNKIGTDIIWTTAGRYSTSNLIQHQDNDDTVSNTLRFHTERLFHYKDDLEWELNVDWKTVLSDLGSNQVCHYSLGRFNSQLACKEYSMFVIYAWQRRLNFDWLPVCEVIE
jgi:hypothetical protein